MGGAGVVGGIAITVRVEKIVILVPKEAGVPLRQDSQQLKVDSCNESV